MRKRMIAAVIIALTVIVPAVVFAAEREKTVILPEGDTVSDNFVAFGETIEISGTVEGDVYAFGSSVILTSTGIVNGDFISAGSTVDIWGNVLGNVRAAGSTVTLTGSVGRNMSAAGSTVRIESNGVVGWSTQLVGNTIVIAGTVAGQANAYGNDLRVDGTVGGDTQMTGRTITVSSDATLNGDLTYRSDAAARISDSATIGGTVIQKDLQTSDAAAGFVRWMRSIAFFAGFFGTILVGLLLILVLPKTSARTIQEMRKRSWQHILIGIALLIGVPIIAGLLMATIVGIPLALVILALYVMFLFFGKIYAGWMLGAYLKDRLWKDAKWHSALVMLFGVTLLLLIGYIPFLGPLIVFIGTVWGFSAYVAAKMSVEKEAK